MQDSNCLSTEPITFHYLSAMKMLEYEFLLYRARVISELSSVDKNEWIKRFVNNCTDFFINDISTDGDKNGEK